MGKLLKTICVYLGLTVFAFLFDKIYALFGHGVTSSWMANMYFYFLGFGVIMYLILYLFLPNIVSYKNYRIFYNTYNTGVAILVDGMLLKGILEIAGGESFFVNWFLYIGVIIIIIGILMLRGAISHESEIKRGF